MPSWNGRTKGPSSRKIGFGTTLSFPHFLFRYSERIRHLKKPAHDITCHPLPDFELDSGDELDCGDKAKDESTHLSLYLYYIITNNDFPHHLHISFPSYIHLISPSDHNIYLTTTQFQVSTLAPRKIDSTEILSDLPYTLSPTDSIRKGKRTHAHVANILHDNRPLPSSKPESSQARGPDIDKPEDMEQFAKHHGPGYIPDHDDVQGNKSERSAMKPSLKTKRAPPLPPRKGTSKPKTEATLDEDNNTEGIPEYNREITDVLCTTRDRSKVEARIDRQL
jgi:hypothetical protein